MDPILYDTLLPNATVTCTFPLQTQPSLHCMIAVPLPPVLLLVIDRYALSAHTVIYIFYPIPIHNSPVCLPGSEKCRHSIKTHSSLSSSHVGTIPQFFTHPTSVPSPPLPIFCQILPSISLSYKPSFVMILPTLKMYSSLHLTVAGMLLQALKESETNFKGPLFFLLRAC